MTIDTVQLSPASRTPAVHIAYIAPLSSVTSPTVKTKVSDQMSHLTHWHYAPLWHDTELNNIWVKVLRPTWHKVGHFGDVLHSQSLGSVLTN